MVRTIRLWISSASFSPVDSRSSPEPSDLDEAEHSLPSVSAVTYAATITGAPINTPGNRRASSSAASKPPPLQRKLQSGITSAPGPLVPSKPSIAAPSKTYMSQGSASPIRRANSSPQAPKFGHGDSSRSKGKKYALRLDLLPTQARTSAYPLHDYSSLRNATRTPPARRPTPAVDFPSKSRDTFVYFLLEYKRGEANNW